MGSGQSGYCCVTRETPSKEHLANRPQYASTEPIEANGSFLSPEVRAMLARGVEDTGLEVGEDGDDEADTMAEEEESARSVYATSMYPRGPRAHRVGSPYETGHDSATIDSARTLYAEDFDFLVEHGRQYCGDYFLPIDQTEQTRQYVIHQVFLKVFDLELTTVPLDNPRYILDVGTGIGEWAIGMAEKYPQCEVFGTDIAPIQPTAQVPFNVEFHIENAEEEWIRPANTVDLVHFRNMEGAFSNWPFVYSQAFACLKPGGWIEVVDWEDLFADRNFLSFFPEGSAPRTLIGAVLEAAALAGKPHDSRHLVVGGGGMLAEAGFVDVRETVYDLGIGSRESSSYGKFWLFSIVTGIEAACLRLLTRYLGWDAAEVRSLCDKVARETRTVADDSARVGSFVVKLRVVVARKPAVPGQWSARTLNETAEVVSGYNSGDDSTIGGRTIPDLLFRFREHTMCLSTVDDSVPLDCLTASSTMALDPSSGFAAAEAVANLAAAADDAAALPIFDVQRVELVFSITVDFVAGAAANNVLVLALANGRILRIDLYKPDDIDDIDLPATKKQHQHEAGGGAAIRKLFLDPTASHLLICTAQGDNYYLHSQSRSPRPLARLRGVVVEAVAWSPALPTSSTREILIGAADGNVYEAFIETANEFYRKEDKYVKLLHRVPDGGPVTGLWVDSVPVPPSASGGGGGKQDVRRVLIATQSRLCHFVGKVGRGHDGSASIYSRLFEGEQPVVHELSRTSAAAASMLVVSPDAQERPGFSSREDEVAERAFAWLSSHGVYHGKLLVDGGGAELGNKVFAEAKLLPRAQLASPEGAGRRQVSTEYIDAIALTQWHVICLIGPRVVVANRLTGSIVYDQTILDPGQKAIGLCVDLQKSTFWVFTPRTIFEIVPRNEDRDIWKIMLQMQQFDAALEYAHTLAQRDAVAIASGDYLVSKRQYGDAAGVYGKSSKPFEEVALTFIDNDQPDALRTYLLTRLGTYKKSSIMQRVMIAAWLVEVFMAKLNSLDDTIVTGAELSDTLNTTQSKEQLDAVRAEFQDFVNRHKSDLDRKTVYDVISSHGREEELLLYANAVNDYNYVLSYWVQRERWPEALGVLKRQTDAEVFYRYSSVLMTHTATELVEVLMRQSNLKPRNLIPAMLEYDRNYKGPLAQNQAIRYLQYVVNQLGSTDSAVHNTLVSIYASHPSKDESALLSYLESQGDEPRFDPDFALRLCIQNRRVLSCARIYTGMGQYVQAVNLALAHDEVELASIIADRPMSNPALRKKLWLAVAKKVISQQSGGSIKTAIEFLKRCDLLKIEDLIPFFPDFVVIDDFKDEICAALEDYSRNIDALRREMDESSQTAANIKVDIAALDRRYAIVEPGERCYACGLPLLSRQFFVFPCQHAFHSDCLGRRVLEQSGAAKARRIRECQVQISKGLVGGEKREAMIAELDALVASACILCSEYAIRRVDEPFVKKGDDMDEWGL
ncbi:hypothetical protein N658DRAFT_482011 [Parathielavia hyrcaniae]|uniref:Uncharacterized protein n=1 Tax=Parathielavia hyrcaniae TaxID=113614 RepID=A0AAN6Q9I2_9PEZI|nr:hypothetical protein N658DRAFT_482011 [Parathielavia hyrcaniae]